MLTTSVDALQLPDEILNRTSLALEIAVAHYKPPGAAWAQIVILVLVADEPQYGRPILITAWQPPRTTGRLIARNTPPHRHAGHSGWLRRVFARS